MASSASSFDYKELELVELAIFYLDLDNFEDIFKKKICFRKPGAMSKVR